MSAEAGFGARQMSGFKDFVQSVNATRLIAGRDLLGSTGFELAKEGARRVWLVTDTTVRETGLVDRIADGVRDGGVELAGIFDGVPQDSSTEVCERCAAEAEQAGADSFLAVGGGSVIDTAKVADIVFTHGGRAVEQEGFFLLPRGGDGIGPPLALAPLACIPTTAGTGSEVSMGAIVKDPERRIKLEICDFPLFPRVAILDPESTRTLPPAVAAATGMDALTHAIEGYVSLDWDPAQDGRSLIALRLIRDNLERAVQTPDDEQARGNMLMAAALAISIKLGSAHAMSHPCGAQFGVAHGVANAINLPHVIRFNAAGGDDIAARYRDVNEVLGLEPTGGGAEAIGDALASHVERLVQSLGLPTRLGQVGVPESGVAELADAAMGDGLTLMNPREPSEEDYAALFGAAL